MNLFDILLIIMIIFILYLLFKNNSKESNNNNMNIVQKFENEFSDIYEEDIIDNNKTILTEESVKIVHKPKRKSMDIDNQIFVEAQYHSDYRDTITAFNNIVPCQKPMFNPGSLPVEKSIIDTSEVKKMVNDFIKELNRNISNEVPEYRNSNSGWDELIPEKKIKSGWNKQRESLGLPTSLYPDPAIKSKIRLINIDFIEKYETDNEIKYVVYMFIQKKNVEDKLLIKISFIINKNDINESRKFFEKDNNVQDLEIYIEDIFMIGYMTFGNENKSGKKPEDFYNFDGLENQDILDQKVIMQELIKKYKQRTNDMNNFNADLYNDNQLNNKNLPTMMGYNSAELSQSLLRDRKYS